MDDEVTCHTAHSLALLYKTVQMPPKDYLDPTPKLSLRLKFASKWFHHEIKGNRSHSSTRYLVQSLNNGY